jgi:hypothetical protein
MANTDTRSGDPIKILKEKRRDCYEKLGSVGSLRNDAKVGSI